MVEEINPKKLTTPSPAPSPFPQIEEDIEKSDGVHIREIPNIPTMVLQSPINQENLMITESLVSTNNPFSELFVKYRFRKTRIPKIGKKFKKNNYFLDGMKRITLSTNGRRMFVSGGKYLLLLKRGNLDTGFQFCEAKDDFRIFGFRATPSGHVVLQEQNTHNLIILNKRMEKQAAFVAPAFEADNQIHPAHFAASPSFKTIKNPATPVVGFTGSLVNPHFSFEDDKIIWCSDKNNFHIVGLRTLEKVFIKGLHPPENLEGNYRFLCAAANFKNLKFMVVYEFEGGKSLLVFKDVEMENSVYYGIGDIVKEQGWERALVTCLDISKNKERYYMGCTLKKEKGPSAFIVVGTFNR